MILRPDRTKVTTVLTSAAQLSKILEEHSAYQNQQLRTSHQCYIICIFCTITLFMVFGVTLPKRRVRCSVLVRRAISVRLCGLKQMSKIQSN